MPFILRYARIEGRNCNIAIVCTRDAGSTSETIYSKHKTVCCISLRKFTVEISLYFNPFYVRAFLKYLYRRNLLRRILVSIPFISGPFLNPQHKWYIHEKLVSIPFISGPFLNDRFGRGPAVDRGLNPFYFRAFLKCHRSRYVKRWNLVSIPFISGPFLNR